MTADPPPPPITISDPNRPGVYGDVLGSRDEKPPWRPSRRQWQVLLAVGLVLLVALPPTLYLKHGSDERSLDRQALAAVELIAVNVRTFEPTMTVRNDGPATVRVIAAKVDREGYGISKVDLTLKPDAEGTVPLELLAPCPDVVPRTGPSGVRLTVRTARGGERVVRVNIRDLSASFAFLSRIQASCGLFAPAESVEVSDHFQISVVGREIVLHADVANLSVLRRDVTRIAIAEGFRITVSTPLPLALPRAKPGFQGDSVAFDARITVTDCRVARTNADGNYDDDEFPTGFLRAEINGLRGDYPALLFFREDLQHALEELVRTSC